MWSCYWDDAAATLHRVWVGVSKERNSRKEREKRFLMDTVPQEAGPEWHPRKLHWVATVPRRHLAHCAATDIKPALWGASQLGVIFPVSRGFLRCNLYIDFWTAILDNFLSQSEYIQYVLMFSHRGQNWELQIHEVFTCDLLKRSKLWVEVCPKY